MSVNSKNTRGPSAERKVTISTTFSPPLLAAMDLVGARWKMPRAKVLEIALLELFERLPPEAGAEEVQQLLEQHDPSLALRRSLRRQK